MKRRGAPSRSGQRSLFGGYAVDRSDEAVERDVIEAMNADEHRHLPREVTAHFTLDRITIREVYGKAGFCHSDTPPGRFPLRQPCTMSEDTFRSIVRQAMAAGYVAALVKYRKKLAGVPALSRFYSRQAAGRRVSSNSQSQRKMTRAEQAIAMAKAGHSVPVIVTHFRATGMLKCHRSTVYRWLKVKRRGR